MRDALTHRAVDVRDDGFRLAAGADAVPAGECCSLFFSGCSFVNFMPGLVREAYRILRDAGAVDGASFLCCGKLLAFEPHAEAAVPAFELRMAAALAEAGVKRIVAACPNCAEVLRDIVARRMPGSSIRVVALPQALREAGVAIEASAVEAVLGPDATASVHVSCPDRATGEFSENVRALLPSGVLADKGRSRAASFCCGALLRAEGREDAGRAASRAHGREAREAGARAIVTCCVSCAQQLSRCQDEVVVRHYLELLLGYPVDWKRVGGCMTVRFLFEEAHGVRDYVGMEQEGAR